MYCAFHELHRACWPSVAEAVHELGDWGPSPDYPAGVHEDGHTIVPSTQLELVSGLGRINRGR